MIDKLFGGGAMEQSKAIIEKSLEREEKLRAIAREIADLGAYRDNMSMDAYYREYYELLSQLENLFDE